MGSTIYPHPGTWEDQLPWFLDAFNIGMNALVKVRNGKNKK